MDLFPAWDNWSTGIIPSGAGGMQTPCLGSREEKGQGNGMRSSFCVTMVLASKPDGEQFLIEQ